MTYNTGLVNDNNTKNYFASTDLRWAVALGGQVRITRSMAWTLEADYQNSVSNVSTNQPDGYYGSTNLNLQTQTYGLLTGLVWSI
jgi:hypothetical protein